MMAELDKKTHITWMCLKLKIQSDREVSGISFRKRNKWHWQYTSEDGIERGRSWEESIEYFDKLLLS